VAEGEAEAMERFEHRIRHGPPAARVDHVQVDEETASGRETGFTVK
jgi:acylphosphatase